MEIYKKHNIVRTYNPEHGYILQEWLGHAKSSEWQEIQKDLIPLVKQYNVSKIITDTRKLPVVYKADADWTATHIIPQLVTLGLRYLAIIQPEDDFTKMGIEYFKEEAQNYLSVGYFKTFEEAEQYIISAG